MAEDKIAKKKEEKRKLAQKKAEQSKKKEAIERLKPLFYSFALWGGLMAIIYIPFIHENSNFNLCSTNRFGLGKYQSEFIANAMAYSTNRAE